MLTGVMLVVVLGFFLFFIVTKREMLTHLFSLNISNSANQFQTELEKTADQVIKQLENQIAHLEYLLAEADEKIALLEEKIEKAQMPLPQSSAIPRTTQHHNHMVNSETHEVRNIVYSNPVYTGRVISDSVLNLKEADPPEQPKESLTEDKRRLILAMAEQGYNVTEIAQAMGIGKGEIMLVLQLHKK